MKVELPIKVLGCVAQSGGYASATGLTCDPSENVAKNFSNGL